MTTPSDPTVPAAPVLDVPPPPVLTTKPVFNSPSFYITLATSIGGILFGLFGKDWGLVKVATQYAPLAAIVVPAILVAARSFTHATVTKATASTYVAHLPAVGKVAEQTVVA